MQIEVMAIHMHALRHTRVNTHIIRGDVNSLCNQVSTEEHDKYFSVSVSGSLAVNVQHKKNICA